MSADTSSHDPALSGKHAWSFNINFVGRMNAILWLSVVMSVASVGLLLGRGLNFGTDFAGGYEIELHFDETVSEQQIRDVIEPLALHDTRVQRYGAEQEHAFLLLVRDSRHALEPQRLGELREALVGLSDGPEVLTDLSLIEAGDGFSASFARPVAEDKLRAALERLGLKVKDIALTERGEGRVAKVSLLGLADDIAQALRQGLKLGADVDPLARVEFVGPQVGAELRNDGLMAVFYSLLLIFLYVALRFDFLFSPGAIVATLHDIVLTMGFLSLFQVDFNLTSVSAILTLIGFSLNDTVVVFDRIRENALKFRNRPLRLLVNQSINETLSRTILTSGTVLLVTGALLALGGPLLYAFSITMFVGVVVGTYSSIAVASPVYILMRERAEAKAPKTRRNSQGPSGGSGSSGRTKAQRAA